MADYTIVFKGCHHPFIMFIAEITVLPFIFQIKVALQSRTVLIFLLIKVTHNNVADSTPQGPISLLCVLSGLFQLKIHQWENYKLWRANLEGALKQFVPNDFYPISSSSSHTKQLALFNHTLSSYWKSGKWFQCINIRNIYVTLSNT